MKPKSLIPLVVVLAILVALVLVKNMGKERPTLVEQVGLVTLLPEGLSKGDVAKLELYTGAKPDDKLVLAYDAEGNTWRVVTHFNAPAKQETVDKYLDAIVKLKGEPRETGVSDAGLAQYDISDEKAFHVAGYKRDSAEPLFHLLVGKAPSYNSVFLRKADSRDVFVEQTNLRQQAGIYTPPASSSAPKTEDAAPQVPEAGTWLNKDILKLDTSKITKIALNYPDKALVFEKREKPKPEAAPADAAQPGSAPAPAETESGTGGAGESEATEGPAAAAAPSAGAPAPPTYEWVLASGGPGGTFKESALNTLVQKFTLLTASDLVDPAKKAEWGLEPPAYTAVISVEGQPEVRLEAGRPDPAADGYVRVATAKEDLVYKLSKYTFEQLFPKGGDLFDLPGLTLDKNAITAIDITQPEGAIAIARKDGALALAAPVAGLEPQTTKVDTLATTLASWKPADYAEGVTTAEPVRTAVVASGEQTHSLKVYGDAKHLDGAYVRLDDGPAVLVMSRMDVNKVFVKPKDLYTLGLFDFSDTDIAEIHASSPAGPFDLVKENDTWKLTAGGTTCEAGGDRVETLTNAIAELQADGILFGQTALEGAPESTLRVKLSEGAEHTLTFGPESGGSCPMTVSGKTTVLTVSKATRDAMFPAADSLKKPEPAQEAPAAPEAKPKEEAPASPAAEPASVPVQSIVLPGATEVPAAPESTNAAPKAPAPAGSAEAQGGN